MNVFYEEDGAFKAGAILADNNTSLQVEAPHGKRSKVKAALVLIRFEQPPISNFMAEAQQIADAIDVDFLWQCCGEEEFTHDALAAEYFGHAPGPVESAGVLLRLHGAPMYFYKKGRGRYKAAPQEALKAALAGIERKKLQALLKEQYIALLVASTLPPEFAPLLNQLLYKPDRNSIEWKALDEASGALRITPVRLLERCGALSSPHEYHLNRFLFEYFPRGAAFSAEPACAAPGDLPPAAVEAFSIDDATTTEIDDAFSVTPLPGGNWRIGIHIAAPALGIEPGSEIERCARERLSTVYYPGGKITMLPEQAIRSFTLGENRQCPALSLYVEATAEFKVISCASRLESVSMVANLRHDDLDPVFNQNSLAGGSVEHSFGKQLLVLWAFANGLERARRGDAPEQEQRAEYNFEVENDRVAIVRRNRGTPIDKVVSELMIYANSEWGRQLADSKTAAIYRVQNGGKVRMSTVPAAHEGLGVQQYIWASSPLRRYVDLINQRQLVALVNGQSPPYQKNSETLLAAMRDFELTYDAYAEFQRSMERYWCLRWLQQENVSTVTSSVLRDNLVRFDALPLVVRVPSLPMLEAGAGAELAVSDIDLIELTLHCEFQKRTDSETASGTAG
jgi:exoribonuclease-2